MIYPFRCPKCNNYIELVRPASESSEAAFCQDCNSLMDRVWTAPQITPIAIEPYYSPAHGQKIGSKRDLKEANKAYEDKNGSEIIEVGNDKNLMKRKPNKISYDLPREVQAQLEAS